MKNNQFLMSILIIFAFIFSGCEGSIITPIAIEEKTNAELIQLLEKSSEINNEDLENYNFELIVGELEKRGAAASEAAPTLAQAIAYNRRDSVIASKALIAMGSSAKPSIPYLLQNLTNRREEVRRYSIFVLGIMGEPARCAVPQIASQLWDSEPYVRSVAAGALTEITSQDLVEYDDLRLDPTLPGNVNPDNPEGHISGIAREWWLTIGQYTDWPTENCVLSQ